MYMGSRTHARRLAGFLTVAGLALAATPAAAAAAPTFNCDASALRGTVLGQTIEPVVANRGAQECANQSSGLAAPLPILLSLQAATAGTLRDGPADRVDLHRVLAAGGVADLRVRALPELPVQLPTAQISDAYGALVVPLTGTLSTLLGLGEITIDIRPALNALLPDGRLPALDLLRLQTVMAYAGGSCEAGRPQLTGDSRIAGLTVLGQELPTDRVAEGALSLIDTSSIDPSNIDLSLVQLPLGLSFSTPLVGPLLETAVRTVLDTLPTIAIPATIAQVKVTPGQQTKSADFLAQQALRVQIAVAGQSLADVVVGEARVSSAGVDCSPPAAADGTGSGTAAELALGCTTRRLVLTDVRQRRGRVRLEGVADRRYIGDRVSIRFPHTGRTVARATVRADGTFLASAKLPPRSIRRTNKARYQAAIGRERSLSLKLFRRMDITGRRVSGGQVTLAGRVSRPLGTPVKTIVITRRISCGESEVVRRIKPSRRTGTFRVVLDPPAEAAGVVYRMTTKVRKNTRNRKHFETFTLPEHVELG